MESVADRIEREREKIGLSKNQLNWLCGFSDGYISRVTSDAQRQPKMHTLEFIAAALRVRYDWLARGVGAARDRASELDVPGLPDRAVVSLRILAGRGERVDAAGESIRRHVSSLDPDLVNEIKPQQWLSIAAGELEPAQIREILGHASAKKVAISPQLLAALSESQSLANETGSAVEHHDERLGLTFVFSPNKAPAKRREVRGRRSGQR